MNIRINNINFNLISASPIQAKKEKIKNQNTTNNMTLPGFEVYKSLSFGRSQISLPPQDFLLPENCPPDKYQVEAALSILKGNNTIVTAPTGTGKTAIAHFAVKKNFNDGKKTFYTTPLKALSNQKYNDLKKLFGKENVGIMTGDRKENTQAPIIIMTTEIYRNMVTADYFGKKNEMLNNLKTVVFDEFHYMGDPDRGSVWEESIMYSPKNVQILALSATVGNNKKISGWINGIKGKQADLVNVPPENRHVPLEFRMYNPEEKSSNRPRHQANINMKYLTREYYNSKMSDIQIRALNELATKMGSPASNKGRKRVIEIFRDQYNQKNVPIEEIQDFLDKHFGISQEESHSLLIKLTDKKSEKGRSMMGRVVGTINPTKRNPVHITKLIDELKEKDKLPAIAFVFSKKYSEELLKTSAQRGKVLTTKKEQYEIHQTLNKYRKEYGFYSTNLNEEALLKGYAIHSAAILPMQKQLVEELFNKKLVKVAYATETLAAGINMPARSVIMTDYQKPNGSITSIGSKIDVLRPLSANEFHQMAGRAGRRGIDKIGYVYLINDSPEKEAQFEKLIESDPTPIKSALKVDASMVTGFYSALNTPQDMEPILAKSFSVSEVPKEDRAAKLKQHMREFKDYTTLLNEYGFIKSVQNGYTTTPKGEMANNLKGKPQIPIINAILDNRFEKASVTDIAGLVAGIAANPGTDDKNMLPIYTDTTQSDDDLAIINKELGDILNKFLYFKPEEINESNLNDEIIDAIETKFVHILNKDLDEIQEKREKVINLIKKEEKKFRNNYDAKAFNYITKLRNVAEQLREEKAIIKRAQRVRTLLQARLSLLAQQKLHNNNDNHLKYNIYNTLRKDFINYNDRVEKMLTRIPQITLNPTAFVLVNKWASLNEKSDNYNENWEKVCTLLKEVGSIKYEGDLFNAVAQTVDFLNQLDGMLDSAIKANPNNENNESFNQLRLKCKEAIKLLKTPPLYNSEEI